MAPDPSHAEQQEDPTVLVVDDNEINLKLLTTFMKKVQFKYVEARNGLEAVEAYKAAPTRFQYVLMDISMPVMDGLEATREIRKYENLDRIKPKSIIFALTGLASANAQEEAFEAGVDNYLSKPVKFKELKKLLFGNNEG